jgi:hypothetical protein
MSRLKLVPDFCNRLLTAFQSEPFVVRRACLITFIRFTSLVGVLSGYYSGTGSVGVFIKAFIPFLLISMRLDAAEVTSK